MFRRLGLTLGLAFTPLAVQATGEISDFTLDNGLQVVVVEDHRSPSVTHMIWYRAGAADELPGQGGIAHLLEHLMFNGTDDMAPGEFSETVEANGGSDNAFTSWDYTAYHQTVAADRLGLMMQMEADRMRDLVLVPEEVETEISVVLEERAQRTDGSPGALFNEQMSAAYYRNHPYGQPIIGWRHEIRELTIEMLQDWYDLHYHPNNAIVVVAGDVTPEEVRALAEEHYGPIPANPDTDDQESRVRPAEPPQNALRRVIYEDPRVANPYVSMLFPVDETLAYDLRSQATLELLRAVLSDSDFTSVFARELQIENEVSLFAAAYYSSTNLDNRPFTLLNMPIPGRSLEQAEADILGVVEDFLEEGIDQAAFDRIQFQWQASQIYAQDDAAGQARSLGTALTTGYSVEDWENWLEVTASITTDEVMEMARALFAQDPAVIGHLTRPAPETEEEEVSQ
ncbi:M16 family metallopeptidase [Gymnodinialimonas hymeniacidonis]|uniref:M16 family metallopeptidase n=1 Tax=Gymnodinialimonas hymeniacidonis TaxID=3126508 RepID=UPI0034C6A3EB